MNQEDKTQSDIADKLDSLNLKDEDNYIRFAEYQLSTIAGSIAKMHNAPLLNISMCCCGCGKLNLFVNQDLVTKQQSLYLLKTIAKSMEQEMSNLN